jgi:cobalt/nickel transport system permease protein
MTLGFDLPACQPSCVQRLDPRWKLAGLLLGALAALNLHTCAPALAALAGTLLLVALARLPIGWYARRLAASLVMFALFLAWLPFVVQEGHETREIGLVTLSLTGLERLSVLSAKIASMISLMLVLLATTPLPSIFKAARALWVPRLLVLLMLLSYRYVFLLMEEFARLRTALRVRGFRNRADLHSYRTIGQVAGTLLVRSHERSERVGQAMRCRGFDGEFRALDDFRTAWPDPLAFMLIVGYAVGLLAWDRFAS